MLYVYKKDFLSRLLEYSKRNLKQWKRTERNLPGTFNKVTKNSDDTSSYFPGMLIICSLLVMKNNHTNVSIKIRLLCKS